MYCERRRETKTVWEIANMQQIVGGRVMVRKKRGTEEDDEGKEDVHMGDRDRDSTCIMKTLHYGMTGWNTNRRDMDRGGTEWE